MEFRRARRSCRYPEGGAGMMGASVLIGVVILAIVYLIGVSSAGTWVAEHMIAPAFSLLSGREKPGTPVSVGASAEGNVRSEHRVPLAALEFHALQMGAYTDFENAVAQAKQLQSLGAGGYLYKDGVRYRVLAAGYGDADSLASVRAQLLGEGLDSTAFVLSAASRELFVQVTELEAAQIKRAADRLPMLLEEITALAIEFDREKQSVVVGRSALRSLLSEMERLNDTLSGLRELPGVGPLADCCDGIAAQMRKVCEDEEHTRASLSAALKYTCLTVAVSLKTLLDG